LKCSCVLCVRIDDLVVCYVHGLKCSCVLCVRIDAIFILCVLGVKFSYVLCVRIDDIVICCVLGLKCSCVLCVRIDDIVICCVVPGSVRAVHQADCSPAMNRTPNQQQPVPSGRQTKIRNSAGRALSSAGRALSFRVLPWHLPYN
jgi:hypothetical protein